MGQRAAGCRDRVPRVRGGGPAPSSIDSPVPPRSPRTRGWSRCVEHHARGGYAFPAYAGVVPSCAACRSARSCVPRVRGGGPTVYNLSVFTIARSPRTRGWSLRHEAVPRQHRAFPAYAGVVRFAARRRPSPASVPRVRGGGPGHGATESLMGARSPRTRGWSQGRHACASHGTAFPAYAEVVPCRRLPAELPECVPRVRGGGPRRGEGAGCPGPRVPRVRGGGPASAAAAPSVWKRSPRTRGWSLVDFHHRRSLTAFPAYAGVVPPAPDRLPSLLCVPRVRGGGPGTRA